MIEFFKNLYYRLTGTSVVIPSNIKIASKAQPNSMAFNLALGFHVNINGKNEMSINVSDVIFTSNGDKSRKFIEEVDCKTLRDTIALLSLVASQHVHQSPDSAYKRIDTVPAEPSAPHAPIDPKLLN